MLKHEIDSCIFLYYLFINVISNICVLYSTSYSFSLNCLYNCLFRCIPISRTRSLKFYTYLILEQYFFVQRNYLLAKIPQRGRLVDFLHFHFRFQYKPARIRKMYLSNEKFYFFRLLNYAYHFSTLKNNEAFPLTSRLLNHYKLSHHVLLSKTYA